MTRLLIQVFERHPTLLFTLGRVSLWILKIMKLIDYEVGTGVNFQKMWGRREGGGRGVCEKVKTQQTYMHIPGMIPG
jgi:hypothetical protein